MMKILTCKNCKEKVKPNLRLKGKQEYCSKPECQRARKRKWQREKIKNDEGYKKNQTALVKRWREVYPWHSYMRKYRKTNPDYEEENRQKQKRRNEKRKERENNPEAAKIVKMDALSVSREKRSLYRMCPVKMDSSGKIVKMDTLYVELKQIKGLRAMRQQI